MSQCLSVVVFHMILSKTVRKGMGERMQPWRTPDLTGDDSEIVLLSMTLHSKWS